MAAPFYSQADQDIYASGDRFIPQEQYRLGYTAPPSIANASTGITSSQAAAPYKWPPQGGGGGGGGGTGNKFGLNLDTEKTITVGMANADGVYVPTPIRIAKTDGGMWKNVETNQNVYHGNIDYRGMLGTVMDKAMGRKNIPGITEEGTTTGAEWDEDLDPAIAHKKLNMIQRRKAKKKAGVQAQFEKDVAAARPSLQAQSEANRAADTGGWQSGMAKDEAFMTGPAEGEQLSDTMGSFAQGGRIGFKDGTKWQDRVYPFDIMPWPLKDLAEHFSKFKKDKPETWVGGMTGKSLGILDAYNKRLKRSLNKAQGGRIGYAYGTTDPEEPAEDIYKFMRDQDIPYGEQVGGEITEEQAAMVLDMLEKGMDIPTIMSITGASEADIMSLMGDTSMAPDSADEGLASLV